MKSVSEITISAVLAGLLVVLTQIGTVQPLAFSGAEDSGRFITGGRGGEVDLRYEPQRQRPQRHARPMGAEA